MAYKMSRERILAIVRGVMNERGVTAWQTYSCKRTSKHPSNIEGKQIKYFMVHTKAKDPVKPRKPVNVKLLAKKINEALHSRAYGQHFEAVVVRTPGDIASIRIINV